MINLCLAELCLSVSLCVCISLSFSLSPPSLAFGALLICCVRDFGNCVNEGATDSKNRETWSVEKDAIDAETSIVILETARVRIARTARRREAILLIWLATVSSTYLVFRSTALTVEIWPSISKIRVNIGRCRMQARLATLAWGNKTMNWNYIGDLR